MRFVKLALMRLIMEKVSSQKKTLSFTCIDAEDFLTEERNLAINFSQDYF